mmetsp:Transcript_104132/g.293132  ORF Transcript_104132/g.293132 Transcript_104132/m.293132 type:complete len:94 (+) Transcript_104132:62-343(+)
MAAFGAPMMQTAPLYSPAAAGGGGMQDYSYGGQLPGGEQAYGQTPYPVGDAYGQPAPYTGSQVGAYPGAEGGAYGAGAGGPRPRGGGAAPAGR